MSDGRPGRSRHSHRRRSGSRRGLYAAAALAATLVLGLLGGVALARMTDGTAASAVPAADRPSPSATPSAANSSSSLPSRPTMIAQITRVAAGDEVGVRVADAEMTVRILGLDTPDAVPTAVGRTAECGSREALEYADRRLSGQMVTLVPDPTLPEVDEQGRRLAYVVLRSQLSYTDAALVDGIGRADTSRPLWYADVFAREQRDAVAAKKGIWGPPCRTVP